MWFDSQYYEISNLLHTYNQLIEHCYKIFIIVIVYITQFKA